MSRQESDHPDIPDRNIKAKPGKKKPKGKVVLLYRRTNSWFHGNPVWAVKGRYKTEEQAQQVIDKLQRDVGGLLAEHYEYKIEIDK